MLCLILSILLSLKKFLYCQFIFHKKHILSHVMPGLPPWKTDGFSWYAVHATWPEMVKCITKIDGLTIDDPEDLDLVMLMCNLIECSSIYSGAVGSWWFYFKKEVVNFNNNIVNTNNCKSFMYKAKVVRKYSCRWRE